MRARSDAVAPPAVWASIRVYSQAYDVSATAQSTFKPDAKKILAHRKKLGWSRRAFASESGADEKTIRAIEEGRRDSCQPDTLQKFAAAFEKGGIACTWTDLVLSETASPKLEPRSSLDPLIAVERRFAPAPRIQTPFGPLKRFGAVELADTFTAYGIHEGKRYYVDGMVLHQRGLSDLDRQVLQVKGGHGGKFELTRVIHPDEQPLRLTIWSRKSDHTHALQKAHRKGEKITVRAIVRLIVADFDSEGIPPNHVALTNVEGSGPPAIRFIMRDGELWKGFLGIVSLDKSKGDKPKPHPWALLVESVEVLP
jgi:hypothetical protein